MFNYSFSTVYTAVITSNLLLILITLFFYNRKIMINAGYKLLALFIALTALRFVLPLELPFTKTILLEEYEALSQAISYVRHPLFQVSDYEISPWTFIQAIWLIGFIILLVRYIREHLKARYFVLANSLDVTDTEPYQSLLERICKERGKRNCFRILSVTGIQTPMLYGVLCPCILIPENQKFSDEDLYYSIAHEASHHFHGDLLIKKIVKFIAMVYWWNPFCYILVRKMDTILEMRVDDVITASGKETIVSYLHSLLEIGERSADAAEQALTKTVTMSLLSKEDDELTKRYFMMTSSDQKKKLGLNVILGVLVIGLFVGSYLVIFEAHYATDEVEAESDEPTTANSYIILKDDGTYDVYFNGFFIENTDSLEFYPSDIPIYTEKEISNEKQ